MGKARAVRRLAALLFLCLVCTTAHAQRRPLVVVFAARYEQTPGPSARAAASDKPAVDLPVLAMRAVRDRLADTSAVDAIAYAPGDATFVRAVAENKLTINAQNPAPEDRLALAKALSAVYFLTVHAEEQKEGGVRVEVQATDTDSRKVWTERAHATFRRAPIRSGAALTTPFPDDLLSAANTLVVKFLGGPLKEYTKGAVLPALPPPPAPAASAAAATTPRDPDAEARGALKQGQALIAAGDANGAILALRPAVNLAPRSASLRAALARAYLAAGRGLDAVAEVRRALALVPASDQAGQTELTGLLAQGLTQSGDTTAARAAYEQILAAQPRAHWARLGLAGLLLAQNQAEDAEAHYRAVRRADPANKEAAERLARLLAARGDYAGAREEMAVMSPRLRFALARALFDGGASTVAATLARQRKAYEEGQISREVFHKAASLQAERVSALTVLLRDAPPSAGESLIRAYRRRILAASLLAQAAASVLSYLETGEATAGSQAAVLLGEARREIAEAQTLEKSPSAANRAAEGGAARAAP